MSAEGFPSRREFAEHRWLSGSGRLEGLPEGKGSPEGRRPPLQTWVEPGFLP